MVPEVLLSVVLSKHLAQKELYAKLTCAAMLVHISLHTYPPKIMSDNVDFSADALVSFGIMEFYNDN